MKLACLVETRPASGNGKRGAAGRHRCSTTTIASTTTAPGRRTISRTSTSSWPEAETPCFSWTTFCWRRSRAWRPFAGRSTKRRRKTWKPGEGHPGRLGRVAPADGRGPDRRRRLQRARERRCWTAWRTAASAAGKDRAAGSRRKDAGRRPWNYEPAIAAETDNTVLELLDRVLNTGVVLVRRHHRSPWPTSS